MNEPYRESPTDATNRRAHYRVDYPAHDRPVFTAGALCGAVADCSESGIRVLFPAGLPADASIHAGDRMTGAVRFVRGETSEVEGVVVRYDSQTLVLRLDVSKLPFGQIIKEQLWLRARYPWRDGK
ncbi:MAG: PilZ domain-containing protein [Gemmatimonadetes bacterium]|nr:PilZ domain-containing protein [Gemmatimonadota bacterium]